jgi:hypothetical protein
LLVRMLDKCLEEDPYLLDLVISGPPK